MSAGALQMLVLSAVIAPLEGEELVDSLDGRGIAAC